MERGLVAVFLPSDFCGVVLFDHDRFVVTESLFHTLVEEFLQSVGVDVILCIMYHKFIQAKHGDNFVDLFTHTVMDGVTLVWPFILVEDVHAMNKNSVQGVHGKLPCPGNEMVYNL